MRISKAAYLPYLPASHEDQERPGVLRKVLVENGVIPQGKVRMVNWAHLGVGSSFRPHYHEDMYEVFVLVAGRAQMSVSGASIELEVGDTEVVEPREVHSMRNLGSIPVQYLVFGVATGEGGKTITLTHTQVDE